LGITLLEGDCRQTLATLPEGSVQCVITSPPYYGGRLILREYGARPVVWGGESEHVHTWVAARRGQHCVCGAWRGSLGLEPTADLYIQHLVECVRQVGRVLREDGLFWLNLGDSYGGDKNLLLVPFRVGMALQAEGWVLRSLIPWGKRHTLPESVKDRPAGATAIEYVLLLAKSERNYWDAAAVRHTEHVGKQYEAHRPHEKLFETNGYSQGRLGTTSLFRTTTVSTGRNRRNVDWLFESLQGLLLNEDDEPLALVTSARGFSGPHYASFPTRMVEPMVKASTRAGDTVLDPFAGAGTVGLVADRFGRNAVLCELQPDYASIAGDRITGDAPLFVELSDGDPF
jgi:site-specific DNA-methyltransferase (adenine-specific)